MRKHGFVRDLLARILGQGILTSDGDFHQRQRRLVQPAFHTQRLSNYGGVMVNYTIDMLNGWVAGEHYDIADQMMCLTMRIVTKTLFGLKRGS